MSLPGCPAARLPLAGSGLTCPVQSASSSRLVLREQDRGVEGEGSSIAGGTSALLKTKPSLISAPSTLFRAGREGETGRGREGVVGRKTLAAEEQQAAVCIKHHFVAELNRIEEGVYVLLLLTVGDLHRC